MKHVARRRFGQNFLVDQGIVAAIVTAIDPRPGETVVEIGPGLGALTAPLLSRVRPLHVVEIDRDLVARLKTRYSAGELVVHEGDALNFDFACLGGDLRLVGNLPYNISTPLLFHLADYAERVRDMHFMLQKEVVERMVAEPSTPDYGRLSVMLQYRFVMDKVLDVPPEAFNPPPKVDSAVVRMIPLPAAMIKVQDPARLEQLVSQAFAQRRKTLRNNLRGLLEQADFDALGIDSGLRPENLSVEQFIAMADYLAGRS